MIVVNKLKILNHFAFEQTLYIFASIKVNDEYTCKNSLVFLLLF
jgi:hypothetical protein